MIRVFASSTVTWALTAVIVVSVGYYVLRAARSPQLPQRINSMLHALMNSFMAAMLWNVGASVVLAQIAVLAGAAMWFMIQAVAKPQFKLTFACQGKHKSAYHAFTMVAAACMIATMSLHLHGSTHESESQGRPLGMTHHQVQVTEANSASNLTVDQLAALALPLAVVFGGAALILIFGAVRIYRRRESALRRSACSEHCFEAIGAAAMALMFASLVS
ncbi:DUF5134 domain-containing protein [Paenarthrobacter nicotinovorans]|uniref:DUF5134 domain-containing protein n=1 Tax=Paenarthrobacter nicotinovorans TaxID=29320 RepID=UPI0038180CA8